MRVEGGLAPLEMSVLAADGLVLRGTLAYPTRAAGPFPLAVLAHQYPATRDSFAPLVADLHELGIATLAFDERGHGESIQSPAGPRVIDTPVGFDLPAFGAAFMSSIQRLEFGRIADDILRVAGWGAVQNFIDPSRLALVGASIGGSGAVLAAPKVPGLAALVTLGAAGAPAFGADGPECCRAAVAALGAPVWLASSRDDPFEGGANVESWSRGASHVTTRLVPGAAHAMAIYFDVRDELIAFFRQHLGRR
jgi:dienelactone hydrolase